MTHDNVITFSSTVKPHLLKMISDYLRLDKLHVYRNATATYHISVHMLQCNINQMPISGSAYSMHNIIIIIILKFVIFVFLYAFLLTRNEYNTTNQMYFGLLSERFKFKSFNFKNKMI